MKVLLVDDAPDFLASAADFLARDPRVLVAGQARDGEEGVRLARLLVPDIVFMDLVMPAMNGFDATRRIKAGGVASPQVIIVSLYDDPGIRRSAEVAGAAGFISKANFAELALVAIDAFFEEAAAPGGSP